MFICRPYAPNDSVALIAAINAVCAECPWMLSNRFVATSDWRYALAADGSTTHAIFVVEERTSIIGWCRLFPRSTGMAQPSITDLELGVGVRSQYYGLGIGKKVIQEGLLWSRKIGAQRIWLDVDQDNSRALSLFMRLGFHEYARLSMTIQMVLYLYEPERLI